MAKKRSPARDARDETGRAEARRDDVAAAKKGRAPKRQDVAGPGPETAPASGGSSNSARARKARSQPPAGSKAGKAKRSPKPRPPKATGKKGIASSDPETVFDAFCTLSLAAMEDAWAKIPRGSGRSGGFEVYMEAMRAAIAVSRPCGGIRPGGAAARPLSGLVPVTDVELAMDLAWNVISQFSEPATAPIRKPRKSRIAAEDAGGRGTGSSTGSPKDATDPVSPGEGGAIAASGEGSVVAPSPTTRPNRTRTEAVAGPKPRKKDAKEDAADVTLAISASKLKSLDAALAGETRPDSIDPGDVLPYSRRAKVGTAEVVLSVEDGTGGESSARAKVWVLEPRAEDRVPVITFKAVLEGPLTGRHAIEVGGIPRILVVRARRGA